MPSNIEIKARVNSWSDLRRTAESLADGPAQIIDQLDTFFVCARGRLKLRYLSPQRGELIAYDRPDAAHAKPSRYLIALTTEPDQLREVLTRALEVYGTVRKRRCLYLVGQTRVHLDEVDGLGRFLELEVVMRPDQSDEEGAEIARNLMVKLGVKQRDLLAGAYVDMMASQAAATVPTGR
jgi:predicted adenylyl cyclase CyaB